MAVRIKTYAKLNFTLELRGKQGGYHLLDSLVCTVDLCDEVTVRRRRDGNVTLKSRGMGSEYIPEAENNAVRAARAIAETFQTDGADLCINKNIPIGGGMGGSSADAAGVLRAMAKLYGIADMDRLKSLADRLGSDTGYLLSGGLCRLRGRGDRVEKLGACPKLHFLVLCPEGGVSAAACYAAADRLGSGNASAGATDRAAAALASGDLPAFGKALSNDLFPAAASLSAAAAEALAAARSFSPLGAAMTGSGSASFAFFETRELCEWARSRYRGPARAFCVSTVDPSARKPLFRSPFGLSEEERRL